MGALALPAGTTIQEVDPDSDPTGDPRNTPPDVFRRIIGARIYGPAATGQLGTRVELYFEEDEDTVEVLEAEDEDGNQTLQQIQVFGVNGYSNTSINLSSGKVFKPIEVAYDDPSWAENGLRGNEQLDQTDWRQTPPVSSTIRDVAANTRVAVNSTIWYNPVVQDPDKTDKNGKDLVVTRAVDSATVTGANVVVTLNAASHLFKVGDVISVDIPAPFIGLDYYNNNEPDGLFEITAVTSNTISYVLDAPVTSPTTYEYDEETRHYVYAVARPYVPEEAIWIDDRVEPNKVWVWKKYRWYNTADPIGTVTAEQDGILPSPVTDLEAETEVPVGSNFPVIDLTWTPPTTRANGSSISGFLSGYEIRHKLSTSPTWKTSFIPDGGEGISSYQISEGLQQNFNYNIEVYVVDIMAQRSTAATLNVLTATYSETLNPPAAPTVTSKLGTITVDWSGLDSTGNLPVKGVLFAEIHESTTSGFTPSEATLVESIPISSGGNYAVLTGRLFDNTTFYYYRVIFVREINSTELVKSEPSAQSTGIKVQGVTGPDVVANSITTNNIEAGFVSAELFRGQSIIAQVVPSLRRVEIKASGITAYSSADPTNYSFELQSQTGNVSIVGGSLKTTAGARGVTMSPEGLVAKNSSGANTFVIDAASGNVSINGGSLTISSGLAGYIPTGGAAADVNGVPGTTTINGGKITTGTIDADRLEADLTMTKLIKTGAAGTNRIEIRGSTIANPGIVHLDGLGGSNFRFYANGVSYLNNLELANASLSGTLTATGIISGGTIRTSGSGKRVVLDGSTNEVVFYGTSGTEVGSVGGAGTTILYQGGTGHSFQVPGGTTVFTILSSGIVLGAGRDITSSGDVTAATLTTTGNISSTGGSVSADTTISSGGSITSGFNVTASNRFRQNTFTTLTGTTTAVHRINDTGFFTPTGSDERLKENVENIENGLELINNLRPVKYTYISEAESPIINYGLIAQEVRPFVEENSNIVNGQETEDEYLSLEYIQLIAPLIAAVKELSAKNQDLEARLAALEGN
jgi:hypothetical protein